VVGTISSPETEAQLRGAQAQLLKAKQALAAAVASIAQTKSELDFSRGDYQRAKTLVERGNISVQTLDQRRNRLDQAEPPMFRPMPSVTKLNPQLNPRPRTSSGSRRFWPTWCSSLREAGGCSTGSRVPVR
jgi:hypothetical protein